MVQSVDQRDAHMSDKHLIVGGGGGWGGPGARFTACGESISLADPVAADRVTTHNTADVTCPECKAVHESARPCPTRI